MTSPFLILLYLFLILSPQQQPNFNMAAPAANSFSSKVKLMHIDNPDSPYRRTYNSMEHKYQVWEEMSLRRFAQIFHDQQAAAAANMEEAKVDVHEKQNVYHPKFSYDPIGIFVAKIDIGTPPQEQYLIFDTGSTVTWTNCNLTENMCFSQRINYYSFPLSSSGKKVSCNDDKCKLISHLTCASGDPCKFRVAYASVEKMINGRLLTETFYFNDSRTDSTFPAQSVAFGCVQELQGPIHTGFTGAGVLGMSNGRASLASQLGPSFSYCIANMYDENSPHNSLTLGSGVLVGNSTVLYGEKNMYVNLESIKVGGETLDLDPYMFRRHDLIGGTVIDTGASSTFLLDEAYHAVKDKLAEKMKPESKEAFCFLYIAPQRVPVVQLVFEGGAVLSLGAQALFGSLDPSLLRYCLRRIKPSSAMFGQKSVSKFLSVIGINAQQHHNIGFDLVHSMMYVQESSCDYRLK